VIQRLSSGTAERGGVSASLKADKPSKVRGGDDPEIESLSK